MKREAGLLVFSGGFFSSPRFRVVSQSFGKAFIFAASSYLLYTFEKLKKRACHMFSHFEKE
jgi:hypothetical protein